MSRRVVYYGYSSGPLWQPETTAYMTAIGVPADGTVYYPATAYERTGLQLWTGLNTFVTTLKNGGCWDVWRCIHIPRWGNAVLNKWNLKNVADTDAAHRMQWFGGWAHNITGAKPNGVNAYALPFINPATMASMSGVAWSWYNREEIATGIGADGFLDNTVGDRKCYFTEKLNDTNIFFGVVGTEFGQTLTAPNTSTKGIFTISRIATNDLRVYRDGGQIGINTSNNFGQLNNNLSWTWCALSRQSFPRIAFNKIERSLMAFAGGQLTPALEAVWRAAVLQLMADWNLTAP